jgi:AraC family transcriptional regulator of adaptative response/methylated-DNA-[protein]-cysteine methyltransferase
MMSQITKTQPRLRYGFGNTAIGTALVAVSEAGVASILIGDGAPKLLRELATAFPGSELVEDQAAVDTALRVVADGIDDPRTPIVLPLDVRGSAAERAVWSALRQIPSGETRTYGQIAKALPMSMTAQEVGAACAANVHALAIPCHRVIKADGTISGYRWGVARKRRLLQMEAAA